MTNIPSLNTCVCGIEADRSIGTITQVFEGKEIKINNIPHFPCLVCDEITFDPQTSEKLEELLKHAVENSLKEVNYVE